MLGLLSALNFSLISFTFVRYLLNRKFWLRTSDYIGLRPQRKPLVSILIPVRNEERHLRQALSSVLALRYTPLQVIVINDRSTDRTREILGELATAHPQLTLVEVQTLPEGWLGKTHALQRGLQQSKGEFVLLTDADVKFDPDTLDVAMALVEERGLDHLTLMPRLETLHFLENALTAGFAYFFSMGQDVWHINNPKNRRSFAGIGAFNLIRKSALEGIGGFERFKLEVIDDVGIGFWIREKGYKQNIAEGGRHTWLRYQEGILGLLLGFEKNLFAGCDFRLPIAFVVGFGIFLTAIVPGISLAAGDPSSKLLSLIALLEVHILIRAIAPWTHRLGFLLFPVSGIHMLASLIWSTTKTLAQNGIYWRDHFYPLDALRKGAAFTKFKPWPY